MNINESFANYLASSKTQRAAFRELSSFSDEELLEIMRERRESPDTRAERLAFLEQLTAGGQRVEGLLEPLLEYFVSLAGETHSQTTMSRELAARAARSADDDVLWGLIEPELRQDDESHRRYAELLQMMGRAELLKTVCSSAEASSDPDVREVADDFRP